jgi:LuxR family transcriptional regulator, maltose regulon positive regulatory protein
VRAGRLEDDVTGAFAYAADARAALRRSDWARVDEDIERGIRLASTLTDVLPADAVQVRLELARSLLALGSFAAAGQLLQETDAILEHRPGLGVLPAQAGALRAQIEAGRRPEGGWESSLTAAELRLLPLLTTHLSFREIAERLYVSRNTVKTQAISVYRKLGVSSRSDAIEKAVGLGLVTATSALKPRNLTAPC